MSFCLTSKLANKFLLPLIGKLSLANVSNILCKSLSPRLVILIEELLITGGTSNKTLFSSSITETSEEGLPAIAIQFCIF